MGVEIASGRMTVTRADGTVVLDTHERPALWDRNQIIGNKFFAERATPVFTITDQQIGTCLAGSEFFMGACRLVSNGYLGTDTYWSDLSGTNVARALIEKTADNHVLAHSVYIAGTIVYLREVCMYRRKRVSGSPQPFNVPPYRLHYKIWTGRFHG